MNSLLDTEEEEEGKTSEITLSTASLLGIFFGLVLICGVFFGFGYSMGRGTGSAPAAPRWPLRNRRRRRRLFRRSPRRSRRRNRMRLLQSAAPTPAVARVKQDDTPGDETTGLAPAKARCQQAERCTKDSEPAACAAEADTSRDCGFREADGANRGRCPPGGCRCA